MMRSLDAELEDAGAVGTLLAVGFHIAGREELDGSLWPCRTEEAGRKDTLPLRLGEEVSCEGGLTSGTGSSGRDRSSEGSSISSSVSELLPCSVMDDGGRKSAELDRAR